MSCQPHPPPFYCLITVEDIGISHNLIKAKNTFLFSYFHIVKKEKEKKKTALILMFRNKNKNKDKQIIFL